MARYTGAVCRLCRREGQKLFLKGERCYTDKCAVVRRAGTVPGDHGKSRKKVSEYGIQLRAKQKAKRYYGVLESQFAKYFEMAERKSGVTGENLLAILESRLDNVVYRLGWASSRKEARQLVLHNHFTVNGKKATGYFMSDCFDYDNRLTVEYAFAPLADGSLILYGDANGDKKVSSSDIVRLKN